MTNRDTTKELTSLIRHARRQLAAIRASRRNYAAPAVWAKRSGETNRTRARQQVDYPRVNPAQASLAARWAVADARRQSNPVVAERADRQLERYGVDPATLAREREIAFDEGQRQAEQRAERGDHTVGALVAATAAMVVSAELYENAWEWDEQSPEAFDQTMEQWPETEVVADVSDLPEVTDEQTAELDQVEQIEMAQIPEGLFPYTMEEQLQYVDANGLSQAGGGAAGPQVDAGLQAAPAAGPSV